MDENNRNFILAIVLSIGVLFGWQYFFVPKHPPQQPPGQQTAEQQQATAGAEAGRARPAAAALRGRSPCPGRHGRPAWRRPSRRGNARASACREPARRHRHAEHQGLDQSEGRAHRRRRAQEVPRDRGPEQPERGAACLRPARRTPIMWSMAGSPRPARTRRCRAPTRCGRRSRSARSRSRPRSRSAMTTARGSSSPAPSASTTISCSR